MLCCVGSFGETGKRVSTREPDGTFIGSSALALPGVLVEGRWETSEGGWETSCRQDSSLPGGSCNCEQKDGAKKYSAHLEPNVVKK